MYSKPSKQEKTRHTLYSEADQPSILLDLPNVDYAEYLLNYLYEVGFSKPSSMGIRPIDWIDLNNWSQVTHTELTNWESLTMIYLSKVYVEQWYASNEKIVPAPYQQEEPDKKVIANQVASVLRSMMSRPSNPDQGPTE